MSAETPSAHAVPDGFWGELQACHNVLFDEAAVSSAPPLTNVMN